MTEGNSSFPESHRASTHHLDTDAVCEHCGTVNPEDTLLCRNCGNNLRDQRADRLTQADPVSPQVPVVKRATRWFGQLLAVFGLLLILWTALNVTGIEQWLTSAQSVPTGQPDLYWNGEESGQFDAMNAGLAAIRLATAQIGDPNTPREGFVGLYLLMQATPTGARKIGVAEIRSHGEGLIFAARFEQGFEVRGQGRIEDNIFVVEDAGGRAGDQFIHGTGFMRPDENGSYRCYAVTDASEYSFEVTARALVPATSPPAP